ncbi:MAG: hypothetical protein WD048_11505 [Chitinophagales bacterium]
MYRLLLLILLFSFAKEGFGQKNIYLSLEGGFGHTFTQALSEGVGTFENSKENYMPSMSLGVNTRYDFSEKFSGNIGLRFKNHNYGIGYTAPNIEQSIDLWLLKWFVYMPITLQSNFAISKNKPLFFTLYTGISPGINISQGLNDSSGSGFQSNTPGDTLSQVIIPSYQDNLFALNVLLGIGFEKKTKNNSRWGLKFMLNAGLLKTFEGKHTNVGIDFHITRNDYAEISRIISESGIDNVGNFSNEGEKHFASYNTSSSLLFTMPLI